MKKIKFVIKQEDIPRERVGKGFTIKPMVQRDRKKHDSKMACRKLVVEKI